MRNELALRGVFAAFQVAFGLIVPALFARSFLASDYQPVYWLGIPALCFVVLACLALVRRLALTSLCAAALAGYLAYVVPAAALWLTTGDNYRGGGANIGVALLAYAQPLYLPVLMAAGLAIGGAYRSGRLPGGA